MAQAPTSTTTRGIILAGGQSSRFHGVDKTFLPLAGEPLIAHVFTRLAPQVDAMAISSNAPAEAFARFAVPVLADIDRTIKGPFAGIYSALATWPDETLLTVAVDLPFLPGDLAARLKDRLGDNSEGADCVYASDGDRHALAILWRPGLAHAVRAFLVGGDASLKAWLALHGQAVVFAAGNGSDIAFNINTDADLAAAQARMR